ncbi:MAG TPA: hypothetical protein VMF52_12965 [Steroidobacteraceae bacterium]|nr:hypothetical protein [Steroidobacteraceae bacterium]
MKTQLFAAVVLACGFAVQAQAACDYPVAPGKFPDGTQASLDEMKAAKAQVVKYNADMETYLECIKSEYDSKVAEQTTATPEQKAEMEKVQAQKHNAAVDEVTEVTNRFNEQLRAYKAKAAAEKKPS